MLIKTFEKLLNDIQMYQWIDAWKVSQLLSKLFIKFEFFSKFLLIIEKEFLIKLNTKDVNIDYI